MSRATFTISEIGNKGIILDRQIVVPHITSFYVDDTGEYPSIVIYLKEGGEILIPKANYTKGVIDKKIRHKIELYYQTNKTTHK